MRIASCPPPACGIPVVPERLGENSCRPQRFLSGEGAWKGTWSGDLVCAPGRGRVITGRVTGKSESPMDGVNPRQGDGPGPGPGPGRLWEAFKSWQLRWPGPGCLFSGTERGTAKLPWIFHNFLIPIRVPLNTVPTSVRSFISH